MPTLNCSIENSSQPLFPSKLRAKREHFVGIALLALAFVAPSASAAVYCKSVGVPKGCVARPLATPRPGVGAPGVGVVDPGINQPGAAGNVAVPRAGVGAPGVGVLPGVGAGAPGPGIEAGNRGGPVDRAGRR